MPVHIKFRKIVSVSIRQDDVCDAESVAMGYWTSDAAAVRFPSLKDLEYSGTHVICSRYAVSLCDAYAFIFYSPWVVRLQGHPRSIFLSGIKLKIKNNTPMNMVQKMYAYFFPNDIDMIRRTISKVSV